MNYTVAAKLRVSALELHSEILWWALLGFNPTLNHKDHLLPRYQWCESQLKRQPEAGSGKTLQNKWQFYSILTIALGKKKKKKKKRRLEMDDSSHSPFLAILRLLETIVHKESQGRVVNWLLFPASLFISTCLVLRFHFSGSHPLLLKKKIVLFKYRN